MTTLLALDLATKIGWAVGPVDGEPLHGVHQLPATGEDIGRFLRAYKEWLTDFIQVNRPTYLVFEAPILPGQTTIYTARKLMCMAGLTEMLGQELQIGRIEECHLQSVKKFFTGHGRADKKAMIDAAKRWGFNPQDDNAADALGAFFYTVQCNWPNAISDRKLQADMGGVK